MTKMEFKDDKDGKDDKRKIQRWQRQNPCNKWNLYLTTLLSNDANVKLSDNKGLNVCSSHQAMAKTAQVTSKITKIESVNALDHIATVIVASMGLEYREED